MVMLFVRQTFLIFIVIFIIVIKRTRGAHIKHKAVPGKNSSPPQQKINGICSALRHENVDQKEALFEKLPLILNRLLETYPHLFDEQSQISNHFEMFRIAVRSCLNALDLRCDFSGSRAEKAFEVALQDAKLRGKHKQSQPQQARSPVTENVDAESDLVRITGNYDRFAAALKNLEDTSAVIHKIIKSIEMVTCDSVIIGLGDCGTSVWLEKYKSIHGAAKLPLQSGKLPKALIMGEHSGNWRNDYTLAQPHNLLGRHNSPANAKDFVRKSTYENNHYINARHLFQANTISMAETDAPVIYNVKINAVERQTNHTKESNWKDKSAKYRLKVSFDDGLEKYIYVHKIDACAGLGKPRDIHPGNFLSDELYEKLTQYDTSRKFTPLINGNQFMLTDKENGSGRKIFVYGGGGNAAACFRKSFYGNDRLRQIIKFLSHEMKNEVLWYTRTNFDDAGYGTIAKTSIASAIEQRRAITGELLSIGYNTATYKIQVRIRLRHGEEYLGRKIENPIDRLNKISTSSLAEKGIKTNEEIYEAEVDQLVYAIGQDSTDLEELFKEVLTDTVLSEDRTTGMPVGMKTSDNAVHFFGATALAIGKKVYQEATKSWISRQNINGDAEWPGVMPPSRAQITSHVVANGGSIDAVNLNIDDVELLKRFLRAANVPERDVVGFSGEFTAYLPHS
ncbi:hypothetical protein DdX_18721 [Ditylenchus destructor]|uniref:Uncharacterized protein n=1 Tax=Ditylenchus destructor TaxID=166010 RepID=A0AAD4MJP3_9BILA|nr:hypothetical protein DdX_18721 [Ditylenchus destructor]